jgi:hypothetical protein
VEQTDTNIWGKYLSTLGVKMVKKQPGDQEMVKISFDPTETTE